VNTSQLGD